MILGSPVAFTRQDGEVMSDAVERVARAIYERRNGAGCKPWSLLTAAHKNPYKVDARAALKAIRDLDAETLAHVVPRPDHLIAERNDPEYTINMNAATLADRAAFLSQWQRAVDKMMGVEEIDSP
jgi:hypothetical protein